MEQTVHIFRATNAARSALAGGGAPAVVMTHLAQFTLSVAFVDDDNETIAPLGGDASSARCIVKTLPTASALLLDAELELTGTDTAARYEAEWDDADLDSEALRTALGNKLELDAYLEIEWTIDGNTQRSAFPILIRNAFFRPDDTAPDPAAEASETWLAARAVRFDAAQTLTDAQIARALLNLGIRITAGGYLELTNSDGDLLHIGLNTGAAPE